MKKILLFISIILCSVMGFSQLGPLPKDHPITLAAPHLPLIVRFDGIGGEFHGEKYSYKKEQNTANFKSWVASYPQEVTPYKDAMAGLIKSTDVSLLSDSDKETFTDLVSQYWMIIQL